MVREVESAYRGNEFHSLVATLGDIWHLIPCSPVELPASGLGLRPAPLLEEERHASFGGQLADLPDPIGLNGPVSVTGFPAHNHPVNAAQVEPI
jgi:hypothetical protein